MTDEEINAIVAEADKELADEVTADFKERLKDNARDLRNARKVVQNIEFRRTRIVEELKAELSV